MSEANLQNIPLASIRENKAALRPVNRKTEQYQELVASIKDRGVFNAIVVRPMVDEETGETYYGLVDGLHRFTASKDAGRDTIPCQIVSLDEAGSLEAQIISNIQRIETRPVEYSKGLQRLLSQDPTMSIQILAAKLAKSKTWVSERLGLLKLSEGIAKLVDEGRINLVNAFSLAKLPVEEQSEFVERAMEDSPQEFAPAVLKRKKEIEKAKREGRDPEAETWAPVAHLRSVAAIREELDTPAVGAVLVRTTGVQSLEEAFELGVKWTVNLDPQSVEVQRARNEERKRAASEKRDAAKAERARMKAERSTVISERLRIEASHVSAKTDPTEDLAAFDKAHGLVDGKFPNEAK